MKIKIWLRLVELYFFAYGAGSFIAPIILGIIFTFLNYEVYFIYLTIGFFLGLYNLEKELPMMI